MDFSCRHSSLSTIVLLWDWLKNFNKSLQDKKHKPTIYPKRLCDSEAKYFRRSIKFVVEGYTKTVEQSLSEASNYTHRVHEKTKIKVQRGPSPGVFSLFKDRSIADDSSSWGEKRIK